MFNALVRALGRVANTRDDAAPLDPRHAWRADNRASALRVAVRRAGVATIAAAALAPTTASAQSAGCARVNSPTNSLNFNAVFSVGNLNSSTARYSTTVSDQGYNAIRITATSDMLGGNAQYDTGGSWQTREQFEVRY